MNEARTASPVSKKLAAFAVKFDAQFDQYLQPAEIVSNELVEAVRYAALGPGKRIRPYLVVRCCELIGGRREEAWPAAAAIECIHSFSLIHDDLPAMDDDDLRRGRPTVHKKYNEAIAILAGDALAVLPFELLIRHVRDSAIAARMVFELAQATGWTGMIGGQAADLAGETAKPSLELVKHIHERKTARLFQAACRLGAISGRADERFVELLGSYGCELGRAFQIADDLLDVMSTASSVGKDVGKDIAAGKQSYPRCVGIEESRKRAVGLVRAAIDSLSEFGPEADDLRELARFVADRNY